MTTEQHRPCFIMGAVCVVAHGLLFVVTASSLSNQRYAKATRRCKPMACVLVDASLGSGLYNSTLANQKHGRSAAGNPTLVIRLRSCAGLRDRQLSTQ